MRKLVEWAREIVWDLAGLSDGDLFPILIAVIGMGAAVLGVALLPYGSFEALALVVLGFGVLVLGGDVGMMRALRMMYRRRR